MPHSSSADSLFDKAAKAGASDVHIAVSMPVLFRINGELVPQGKSSNTRAKTEQFIKSVVGTENYKKFEAERELDASYGTKSGVRLRINCHFERGNPGVAARIIPTDIPGLEDIGLQELEYLCDYTDVYRSYRVWKVHIDGSNASAHCRAQRRKHHYARRSD